MAVGRAIVRQPQVFLFDEPLSNLDAALRVQMRSEINQMHQRLKATMIYVTHDQVEAMTMADRIVVMRAGKIEQVDTPLALYHHPVNRFVAGFIGSPAMNFAAGSLDASGRTFAIAGGGSLDIPAELAEEIREFAGRPVHLGIRPEDMAARDAAAASYNARVDLVEPMGSETFVHFRLGADPALARLSGDRIPTVGETVELRLDLSRAHLFDAATGAAVWHGGGVPAA